MAKGKSAKRDKEKRKKEEEEKKLKLQESQLDNEDKTKKEVPLECLVDLELQRSKILQYQQSQLKETESRISAMKMDIEEMRMENWNSKIWDEYMSCSGKPNLEEPTQLNEYISKLMENKEINPDKVMLQCNDAVKLLFEIENGFFEARHLTKKVQHLTKEVFQELNNAIRARIDVATLGILKDTSLSINPETGNSFCKVQNETVKLGVWSNMACNPRYNGLDVSELGVNFIVPRTVITSESAVRIIIIEHNLHSIATPKYLPMEVPIFATEDNDTIAPSKSIKEITKAESVEEGFVDTTKYIVVGPMLHLHLLIIPPQPYSVRNDWVMTKVEDSVGIQHIPWSCDVSAVDAEESAKKDDENQENEQSQTTEEHRRLLQVTWKLPDDILWFDIPKLVLWNDCDKTWSTAECHHTSYKEDQTKMSFCASSFGTFAVLLPRFASLPYQSWEVLPRSKTSAVFSITTITAAIEIAVNGGKCSLLQVQSNEKLYLEKYYGREYSPPQLLKIIQSVGIFLTPAKESHLLTNHIKEKNTDLEAKLYCQIALLSTVIGFSYSRWNGSVGRDKFVVRLKDKNNKEASNGSHDVILVTEGSAILLAIYEVSQNFSEVASANDPGSADLVHLADHMHEEGIIDRLAHCDCASVDAVYQLLAATRVLCS